MEKKVTLSVIKADVGGWGGHSNVHPELLKKANECLSGAKAHKTLVDFHVTHVGDDIVLIMTHKHGLNSKRIHQMSWNTFMACAEIAKKLKQYNAGQDLLKETFSSSGTLKGMGPGFAEMEFEERGSEPVIVFAADKTGPAAWNLPLYKMYASPFNTPGLIIDPSMQDGFIYEVLDLEENRRVFFKVPQETNDMLVFVGAISRYCIKSITTAKGEIVASSSTQKLSLIADKYVGKDDPVCVVRCQSGLVAVGEALEAFRFPHLVPGWMRGSHWGPLMAVSVDDATPTCFDGPPLVIALGFQLAEGQLGESRDYFAHKSFDKNRELALFIADYMRQHGVFEPHRLPLKDMEYTTFPLVRDRYKDRWGQLKD